MHASITILIFSSIIKYLNITKKYVIINIIKLIKLYNFINYEYIILSILFIKILGKIIGKNMHTSITIFLTIFSQI